jgi:hypothetical protein
MYGVQADRVDQAAMAAIATHIGQVAHCRAKVVMQAVAAVVDISDQVVQEAQHQAVI